ncbi:MAG: DUF418 domain-containing protein [Acidobacteriota bacterium]
MASPDQTPTRPSHRIASLDVLRGFALLGILLMNIQSFARPQASYMNPTAWGSFSGHEPILWALVHAVADQKFMTLFSLLFGAGIALMTDRLEKRNDQASPLPMHYWRTFLLLLIGLSHAYLLWFGDILVTYALCGFLVVLFRRLEAKNLIVLGLASLIVGTLLSLAAGWSLPFWTAADLEAQQAEWRPSAELLKSEIEIYRSDWWTQMQHRVPAAFFVHSSLFLLWGGWRAGGLMLIGMALYRSGVLTGERSPALYRQLMGASFALGIPLVLVGILTNFAADWSLEYSMFLGSQWNYWGSLGISFGYLGGVMLLCRQGTWPALQRRLAAVGRMALTNYLLQSALCTLIFYGGVGLGLFGRVDRAGLILVCAAVWTLQLAVSEMWLRRFHFGPAEWLWRSMTYRSLQPWRRGQSGV